MRHDYGEIPERGPRTSGINNPDLLVKCPECEGHGMWWTISSFSGKKMKIGCIQCNGWGWVRAESSDATCIHKFRKATEEELYRNKIIQHEFDHSYICEKCGKIITVNSSG